ncbi:MAG: peptide chain release factor N(5)-glutamine methyltransferase [Bacteroidales bacterium]
MDQDPPVVHEVLKEIRNELKQIYPPGEIQGISELIFENLLNYSKTDILLNSNTKISKLIYNQITEIINQLLKNKPIQYILGEAWFYDIKLEVSPDVLIPRQETEELVKWVIEECGSRYLEMVDLGTGSGCIAIALALNLPNAKVYATDISARAVQLAEKNALVNNADVKFFVDNIFNPLFVKSKKFDIIVSNPPYVTESEKPRIDKNVLHYEPVTALFVPDQNSLLYYKAIAALAREALTPGGRLYLEINESKSEEIEELLIRSNFSQIEIRKDINGKFRMVRAVL